MAFDDPVEVAPGIWQVTQRLSDEVPLHVHLVVGTDGAALVDGGLPDSLLMIERLLAVAGDPPLRYLLNTHAHHDHIGTFAALRERTGARLLAHPGAVRWIEDLAANRREFALHRPDLVPDSPQLRAELDSTYGRPCPVDLAVLEGARVRLGGGVELVAVELPGHVLAELGWFEPSSRTLLLGDAVTGTKWSFFHGHLDPGAYRRTLHRLRALVLDQDLNLICSSHHGPHRASSFVELLAVTERYVDQVTAVVEDCLGPDPVALHHVWHATCAAMGRSQEFRGLAMVQAHLDEAVAAGRAQRVGPDLYVGTGLSR